MTEVAAPSERVRRLRVRRAATEAVDTAQRVVVGLWALVAASGIFSPEHHVFRRNSLALVLLGSLLAALLIARRLLDPVTPLREAPLIQRLGELLARPAMASRWFVPCAVGLFVALIGAAAVSRHAAFASNTFDLGLFENVLWNTVRGRILWSDVLGRCFLGEHVSPILLGLAIPYALVPRAETLLVIQTAALAAGAFPLARLAKHELREPALTAALVIAYLAYLPLRNVARFDFHPVALATPLLLEAFVSFREQRWRRATWAWALALGCDEGVAPAAAALGVYVIVVLGNRKLGALLASVAVAWFVAALLVIVPAFRHGPYPFVDRLGALRGGHLLELISLDRFAMVTWLLAPLAFLPLLAPTHLALALPSLALNWLSDSPPMHSIAFHYTSTVTPLLFVATVFGIAKLVEREDLRVVLAFYPTIPELQRYVAVLLVVGAIVFSGWSPIAHLRARWGATRADRVAVLARLPPDEAVSAQGNLGAHLARRRGLALFPQRLEPWIVVDGAGSPWPLAGAAAVDAWRAKIRSEAGCSVEAEQGAVSLFHCDPEALARLASSAQSAAR